jgi:hypothetical protein
MVGDVRRPDMPWQRLYLSETPCGEGVSGVAPRAFDWNRVYEWLADMENLRMDTRMPELGPRRALPIPGNP